MFDEIPRHLVESLLCRDDVVVPLQLLFEPLLDVDIVGFQFLQLGRHPLVEFGRGHPEFFAASVVVERDRRLILDRPLEIVGGYIIAEDPPGDLVVLEERRPGKADIARPGQGVAHVQRQHPILRAMGLVGNDDHVIALRIPMLRVHFLVELLNQREDVSLVLAEQPLQVVPIARPAGVLVVIGQPASGKGLVDLADRGRRGRCR